MAVIKILLVTALIWWCSEVIMMIVFGTGGKK